MAKTPTAKDAKKKPKEKVKKEKKKYDQLVKRLGDIHQVFF